MTDAERLEVIARQFHETYEALSKDFCWETQPRSRVSWDEVPAANKALTRATVNKVVGPLLAEVERLRGVVEVALAQVGTTCRRPTNITDTRGRVGHPCGEPAKCLPCALADLEAKP